MADVYCDYIDNSIKGIKHFSNDLLLVQSLYSEFDAQVTKSIMETRNLLKIINGRVNKFFSILSCCEKNPKCKQCLDAEYKKIIDPAEYIIKDMIISNRKLEEISRKHPKWKILYNLFIKRLHSKTLTNLEDFITFLQSFSGEDGPLVDSEELHTLLLNV